MGLICTKNIQGYQDMVKRKVINTITTPMPIHTGGGVEQVGVFDDDWVDTPRDRHIGVTVKTVKNGVHCWTNVVKARAVNPEINPQVSSFSSASYSSVESTKRIPIITVSDDVLELFYSSDDDDDDYQYSGIAPFVPTSMGNECVQFELPYDGGEMKRVNCETRQREKKRHTFKLSGGKMNSERKCPICFQMNNHQCVKCTRCNWELKKLPPTYCEVCKKEWTPDYDGLCKLCPTYNYETGLECRPGTCGTLCTSLDAHMSAKQTDSAWQTATEKCDICYSPKTYLTCRTSRCGETVRPCRCGVNKWRVIHETTFNLPQNIVLDNLITMIRQGDRDSLDNPENSKTRKI